VLGIFGFVLDSFPADTLKRYELRTHYSDKGTRITAERHVPLFALLGFSSKKEST
jgi:hypothetical protein